GFSLVSAHTTRHAFWKPVKRPVLKGPFCAWAIDAMSRYFSGAVFLFAVLTSHAAGYPVNTLAAPTRAMVNQYCLDCHDGSIKKGNLDLESLAGDDVAPFSGEWEKVVRKLRARQMPPVGKDRPSDKSYDESIGNLTALL